MWFVFVNTMPRYEILSPDAITVLDKGWRRIVSEIGVQFAKPEAVDLFAKAGQRVDGEVVYLDPEFVLEQGRSSSRGYCASTTPTRRSGSPRPAVTSRRRYSPAPSPGTPSTGSC
jgi:trimethylamine:corrinoid methyltransferase-like protein